MKTTASSTIRKPAFRPLLVALLLPALLASACASADRPSDQEIAAEVKAVFLANGSDQVASLENFKKTNGYVDEKTKNYVADVSFDVAFKKSYADLAKEYQLAGKISPAEMGHVGWFIEGWKQTHSTWTAGQHFPVTESVALRKTEKGWKID